MIIYIDGRFVPREEARLSVFDHGFLYGDGVFEGIRAYNGRVFRLQEHLDRLYDSARAIDLAIPVTKEEMTGIILETLGRTSSKTGISGPLSPVESVISGSTPGNAQRPSIIVIAVEWGAMYGDLYEKGLKAITVSVRRNPAEALPPNIKSLNYLNNILGKIEANYKGGDEAIFFDTNGYLSEGSGDNIFVVKNGVIYHPPYTE